MNFFSKYFTKEPCNLGRQRELDIGKAVPILCLPFVHCIIECCTEEQLLHGVPYAFDMIIGGPMAAPMFMFCMGATIHYSLKNTAKDMAMRGLKLSLVGFLLNICRFLIPYLIGYAATGDEREAIRDRVKALLSRFGLTATSELSLDEIAAYLNADKKRTGDRFYAVFADEIGCGRIALATREELLQKCQESGICR